MSVNDDGNVIGVVKDYYINGGLQWTGQFSSYNFSTNEGVSEGLIKSYHENGELSSEENYVNDLLEGLNKSYHENGELSSEQNYVNGKLLDSKCWDIDGNEIECE